MEKGKRKALTPQRFDEEEAGKLVDATIEEILVRCPRCEACAAVIRKGEYWWTSTARLACRACGLFKEHTNAAWQGPVVTNAHCRCCSCGQQLTMPTRPRSRPPVKRTIALDCLGCGETTETELKWSPHIYQRPFDPWFGLPLWLQSPCCGKVLWAYSRRHLEFLRRYVTASLRERKPNRNASIVSRLPKWLKHASNRDEVLRCIERLARA